ncbi:MAG: C4-type zinc ribbon domain-containing protein [Bacteroidota bacterium]|nr:C4-type zinc ribbon domain-containing protein [Bacteroidota bacterium]
MAKEKKKAGNSDLSVEEKLKALFELQTVDSKIDEIKVLRGELPLEVEDLEDEIAGLDTRVNKFDEDVKELEESISNKKNKIKESEALIKKYKTQKDNVRNNREFDSLSKEIEFQTLEIELSEKRIKEYTAKISEKTENIKESKETLEDRKIDLENKKGELEKIVAGTQKDEDTLLKKSEKIKKTIEERLINAYEKLRKNARNGLAVVAVERDACGGCFNKIPPQRQMDVRTRKKIIVCEYCGRILVDSDMKEEIK